MKDSISRADMKGTLLGEFSDVAVSLMVILLESGYPIAATTAKNVDGTEYIVVVAAGNMARGLKQWVKRNGACVEVEINGSQEDN